MTTSSDETGLHLLVADRKAAYAWRTAATLNEPGLETDQWIGQFCITSSGRWAVVVYAPRQFANREASENAGGFAAVVDLDSGAVTKLAARVSLAYYNPGCGANDMAVLSRLQPDNTNLKTVFSLVDAAHAEVTRTVAAKGELTSAVPYGGDLVAATGKGLVRVDAIGRASKVADTDGTPYRVLADGSAGLAFQLPDTADPAKVKFARYSGGQVTSLGTSRKGVVRLRPGAGGRVFLVGSGARSALPKLPASWRAVDAAPDSDVSTEGALAVMYATTHREAATRGKASPDDRQPDPVQIVSKLAAGASLTFVTTPSGTASNTLSPSLTGSSTSPRATVQALVDASTVTWDPDRACAVPRNDPKIQVYQPSRQQVEWAADLAVLGNLNFQRPANWINNGLPAYSPQGLFQPVPLIGASPSAHVPAQVLLGILAQESNLSQASYHAVPGSSGNPLTSSGFYGIPWDHQDPLTVNFQSTNVDCGYGVGQVTTGMRASDTGVVLSDLQQKAVALDYATNIAASLRLLEQKWNETKQAGIVANDGDPLKISNWFFAVWDYNSGFHPNTGSGPWGLGWLNNPANPIYPPDRHPFLTTALRETYNGVTYQDLTGYDNAKHPSSWSYPERIMGYANKPDLVYDYSTGLWVPGYAAASWLSDEFFVGQQPGVYTFCDPVINQCDRTVSHRSTDPRYSSEPPGPCIMDDLTQCWWHTARTWNVCTQNCGTGLLSYTTYDQRPFADSIHPEQCQVVGLPFDQQGSPYNVRIIDDITSASPLGPDGCSRTWTPGGTFGFRFPASSNNVGVTIYPSKVDLHQIGAGFGGHLWFTHPLQPAQHDALRITGTWTVNTTNAWTRVWVHIPDTGADTQQADYAIHQPNGVVKHRVIPTRYEANSWVLLGTFDFTGPGGSPFIELSNFTQDGLDSQGNGFQQDIAWDAMAVQPLPYKPKEFVVSLGDSYASGEGTGNYYHVSDQYGTDPNMRNACRRSPDAWARKITIPGSSSTLGGLSDSQYWDLDYHLLACSGARTYNVASTSKPWAYPENPPAGSYHELTQLDQGFVDVNTTLVTLTIGGNDAGFANTLQNCFQVDCTGDEAAATALIKSTVRLRVVRVLNEIRELAPNAKIVLAGYPHLFEPGASFLSGAQVPTGIAISPAEADMFSRLADHLHDDVLLSASVLPGVIVADPRPAFQGHCISDWFFTGYLNGAVLPVIGPSSGEELRPVGMASFHPNTGGTQAYATTVSTALSQAGYSW